MIRTTTNKAQQEEGGGKNLLLSPTGLQVTGLCRFAELWVTRGNGQLISPGDIGDEKGH